MIKHYWESQNGLARGSNMGKNCRKIEKYIEKPTKIQSMAKLDPDKSCRMNLKLEKQK